MASVVLSVGLDPLLIRGIGPFPRLGVQGAALTSVMVRGGGFLIGIGIAWRRRLIRLDVPDWRAVPTLLRVGAPLSLAGVLLSVVYMWLTRYTSAFGTAALAALGIGHKMEGLGFIAISGFALSASALVGQNLGARQEARARQAVRMTVGYCLGVTTTTAVAFLTIPGTLVALFTSDAAVMCARRRGLHAVASTRQHHADAAARAPRRLVVGSHRAAGHLARALGHGRGARHRDGAVLGEGPLAGDGGMTTRNAEVGTRNIRNEVGPPVPRSTFRVPTF